MVEVIASLLHTMASFGLLAYAIWWWNSLREPTDTPPPECEDPKFCTRCCAVLTRGTGREYILVQESLLSFCAECAIRERKNIDERDAWTDDHYVPGMFGPGRVIIPVIDSIALARGRHGITESNGQRE